MTLIKRLILGFFRIIPGGSEILMNVGVIAKRKEYRFGLSILSREWPLLLGLVDDLCITY